ncbi:unnamed protein product [Brassica rapa subsp. trilocularis]
MDGNKCVGNCKGYARGKASLRRSWLGEDNINMIIPEGC